METKTKRYALLDQLRGLTFISMLLYHATWDLVYLFGVSLSWYAGMTGRLWQQSIGWTFILLSGFCSAMSHRIFRRGMLVLAAGTLITVATALFMPESVIHFGVLTLLGSSMLIVGVLRPILQKIPAWCGLAGNFFLFGITYSLQTGCIGMGTWTIDVPSALYQNMFTAYLGFPHADFCSTDYYPLFPWLFLFICGYYLYYIMGERRELLHQSVCAPLGWVGRNSLLLYMLHQPAVYGILYLLFVRKGA